MKVAIYLRVSREELTEENQLRDCLEFVQKNNLGEPEVLREEALSAWKDNVKRPILDEMLKKAQEGYYQSIVVWEYDRLYRRRLKVAETIFTFWKKGIQIYSVRTNIIQ